MFNFLKSKTFWLTVGHGAIVAAGAYASFLSGTPLPAVIAGGLNALIKSPISPSAPQLPASSNPPIAQ